MNIASTDLAAEYRRATADWPFITEVNNAHGLPPCLLHAVGSRETNLRNVVGDGGHGHGVFQLDDRSHQIPPGFDQDVRAQAETAAQMLQATFNRFGDWAKVCNYYNSGSPETEATTGRDYGPDVMQRQAYLASLYVRRNENMITNYFIHGKSSLRLGCPVGSASAITAQAWISATINGPQSGAHIDIWFQSDATGIGEVRWDLNFTDGRSDRRWTEVPDGTTQINIEHNLPDDGTICLETLAK